MRRLPMMLASASAAALTTLAITVAVPAIADNAGGAKTADEFPACLRDHGVAGAPTGADLKRWLGARMEHGDAVAERAVEVCGAKPAKVVVQEQGPSEQQLRSCLTAHGVALPAGDGRVLKTWLLEHGDDAANRDAMKACHFAPPEITDAGPCASQKRVTLRADEAGRASKPATSKAVGAGAK
jgi:hypothetical protein